jgi:hypothetical protein
VEALKATAPRTNNETTTFFMELFLRCVCAQLKAILHGSRPRSLINAELAERSQNYLEPIVIVKFTGVWAGLL